MRRPHNYIYLLCFLLLQTAFGLPEDSKEKVVIAADRSIYNYKTGVNQYEGHVKVDQGTTHLTADRLVTKDNNQHKMKEAIAYGIADRAHYWTLPKLGDPEIHAFANIIKFYPIESNVTLQKNVLVQQGDNTFRGDLIHYNNYDQTIIVPPSQKGRAVVVYHPEKKLG